MAVSAFLYGSLPAKLANKEVNWSSDTIKVALCTSTYVPNQDTHTYFSDITNEVTGTGYTAGGATLASKTVTYAGATNKQTFDAADTSWPTSTITARYAVIYDSTGTASTSALIGYVDFGADVVSSGGTFSITWDAAGIFTVTVS
jgi:hypothetical protein